MPSESEEPRPAGYTSAPFRRGKHLVIFAFAISVFLLIAWLIRHALLVIYVSAILATVLKPGVDWLHHRSIFGWSPGRGAALLLLVAVLSLAIGGFCAIALPSLFSDASDFAGTLAGRLTTLERRLPSIPILRQLDPSRLQSHIPAAAAKILPAMGNATTDLISALLLISYFILDGRKLMDRLLRTVPPEPRPRLRSTIDRAARRMRRWLAGKGILMAILGSSAALTFGLIGLPYFYLLALFAGVANIVPMLGPLATVLVAGAVAATQSGWDVLAVVVFYLVYQQVGNAFLTPRIMESEVELPPAAVIAALLIGGELAGIAGALIAVPSGVLVAELAGEYLEYPSLSPGGGKGSMEVL